MDGWLAAASAPFRWRLSAGWEDVQQELRLEVLELLRSGRFRGESSLKTYLWRVACHTCLDALRRQRRRPQEASLDEVMAVPPADDGPSPLEAALRAESLRTRMELIERQPAECRELWRAILRGQSYADISARTGVSPGTLRVRAHRCRQRALAGLRGNDTPASDAQGE